MIEYSPEIYPDELLYSVVGRFMCHSGILSSRQLPEDVFGSHFWRTKTFCSLISDAWLRIFPHRLD